MLGQVLDIGTQLGVLPDAQGVARVRGQQVLDALVVDLQVADLGAVRGARLLARGHPGEQLSADARY